MGKNAVCFTLRLFVLKCIRCIRYIQLTNFRCALFRNIPHPYPQLFRAMGLLTSAIASVRNTVPFLRPLREIIIAFGITGWLIYKIPLSGQFVFSVAQD